MDPIKCDAKYKADIVDTFEKDVLTPDVKFVLNSDVTRIAKFYMLDAILSTHFTISVQEAMDAWNRELQVVEKIDAEIKQMQNVPRVYKCLLFGVKVLDHLRFQGQQQLVCGYAYDAFNFLIAIAKTNQCLCKSYTLYVQALAEHFHYDDCIHPCKNKGHIYNIAQDDTALIGFDAGFENNVVIDVQFIKHDGLSIPEIKHILQWDKLRLREVDDMMPCLNTVAESNDAIFNSMYSGAMNKSTFQKAERSVLFLSYLFPEKPYLRERIKYDLVKSKLARALFSRDLNIRKTIPNLEKIDNTLRECVDTDTSNIENPLNLDPAIAIRSLFILSFEDILALYQPEPLPENVEFMSYLFDDILQEVGQMKTLIVSSQKPDLFNTDRRLKTTNIFRLYVFNNLEKDYDTLPNDVQIDCTILHSQHLADDFELQAPNETTVKITVMPQNMVVVYYRINPAQRTIPLSSIITKKGAIPANGAPINGTSIINGTTTTTAPVTTAPVTTAPVTTTPLTGAPATSAPAMSAPATTAPVTTATTAPLITAPVTTAPVTTTPMTTGTSVTTTAVTHVTVTAVTSVTTAPVMTITTVPPETNSFNVLRRQIIYEFFEVPPISRDSVQPVDAAYEQEFRQFFAEYWKPTTHKKASKKRHHRKKSPCF